MIHSSASLLGLDHVMNVYRVLYAQGVGLFQPHRTQRKDVPERRG